MGACCTSDDKNKKRRTSNLNSIQMKVDEIPDEVSNDYGKRKKTNEKPIIQYLKTGNARLIQDMIDKKEIDVNEYVFGGDKTVLHEAVQISDHAAVVDVILKNKADVNAVEKETGNTALFLAALDLKVEIVRTILNYNPDMTIKNNKNQDVIKCVNENLIEKRGVKKADLTIEQVERLQAILDMLKAQLVKSNVENLDEEQRPIKKKDTYDSDNFRKDRM